MARPSANIFKLKKQRRMRRAYLKNYDMGSLIKTKRKLDKAHIPEEHLGYFDYRKRGNSWWDPYLEAKFPSRGQISKERQLCIDRLNELVKEAEPSLNVVLQRGAITKTILRFYFSSDYTKCFFMREDWLNMIVEKSGTYGSKDRAMAAYHANQINWLYTVELDIE